MMTEQADRIGEIADRLDSLACGLVIPMSADVHVAMLKSILPQLRDELRSVYVAETGDNPWATHPGGA